MNAKCNLSMNKIIEYLQILVEEYNELKYKISSI